jgi:sensor histidine kinase YesM
MHSLKEEFDRVSDYLELMTIRMGSRLSFRLELSDGLATVSCPPLLLQPLVENAIKHGLEPQVKGGRITVTAVREGASLILHVRDTGAGLDAHHGADGTRFGLQQIRERLGALYGTAGKLKLEPAADEEGGTLATVSLPYIEG